MMQFHNSTPTNQHYFWQGQNGKKKKKTKTKIQGKKNKQKSHLFFNKGERRTLDHSEGKFHLKYIQTALNSILNCKKNLRTENFKT